MKIDFFGDHKVKITLELQAQYKCKLEHRKVIGNAVIMEEFNKIHPDKKISKVISGCKINNFSKTEVVSGEWVFELEKPPAPKKKTQTYKKKVQTFKKQSSKKKNPSLK